MTPNIQKIQFSYLHILLLFSLTARVHSSHSPTFRCVSNDDECRSVNCTGSSSPRGNLTIEFGISGSCNEPAQISFNTTDTYNVSIRTNQHREASFHHVPCFWILEDGLRKSNKISSFTGQLKYYYNLSLNASDMVNVEFGVTELESNGSYRQSGYFILFPNCPEPGK